MKVVIVGGAGFIGTNSAEHFLVQGHGVVILDNFSRQGSRTNAAWLSQKYPRSVIEHTDIRSDIKVLRKHFRRANLVLHEAAQTAVTTSVSDPRSDFEINALGTLNVLEALRETKEGQVLIYASTNKVYGGLEHLNVIERNGRYEFEHLRAGVPETETLDFHSPYGCSKGAADQYVRDYSRIFGLRTVVFRQSCVYGPHQFGVEDQGWVAWFSIRALTNQPLTVYGDGKQIRDVLYVADLVQAYEQAYNHIDRTAGQIYNMGGGPANTLSLLELIGVLERWYKAKLNVSFSDWRPGDQRVFVAAIDKARDEFGWQPRTSVEHGVLKLCEWIDENRNAFESP